MTETRSTTLNPAGVFLAVSLLIGLLFCIFIPYGAGFDEERHMIRIYYMSEGQFMPNFPRPTLYGEIIDLSYQRRLVQSPASDLFAPEVFWRRFSRTEASVRYGVQTQSIYSPVIFLPQALIGRVLWWRFDWPVLPVILLQKLAGLLVYCAGAYVAIRLIPHGKWAFAMLALAPSALYQAATLNADGFNTAVSFAFIGLALALSANEQPEREARLVWALGAVTVLLGFAKPGAIVLLPLLGLPVFRQRLPKRRLALLALAVLLAVVINIGWWRVASQGTTFSEGGAHSVAQPLTSLLSDPAGFLVPLAHSLALTFTDQVRGWIAEYGYGAGTVPEPVFWLWLACLAAAVLMEPAQVPMPGVVRWSMAGMFAMCSLAIYSMVFAANYATDGLLALAKHGRYYLPFAPLLFLAVTGSFVVRDQIRKWLMPLMAGAFTLTFAWYSFGLYTTYYTYCGYEAYMGAQCLLPVYKNLQKDSGTVAGLNNGESVRQTFTNQCTGLTAVEVFVDAVPAGAESQVRFTLFDAQGQRLAGRDFAAAEVAPGAYLRLPLAQPVPGTGQQFAIELQALNLPPLEKLRLSVSTADLFPGQLTADGRTAENDLILHYLCVDP